MSEDRTRARLEAKVDAEARAEIQARDSAFFRKVQEWVNEYLEKNLRGIISGGKIVGGAVSGTQGTISTGALPVHDATKHTTPLGDHAWLTNVTADQHHAQSHDLFSADHPDVDDSDTPAEGDLLVYDATASKWKAVAAGTVPGQDSTLNYVLDGGGIALSTGNKRGVRVDFDFEIVGVALGADQSGSVVVDIWVDSHANYPPTVADTITASAKPTLSSAQAYEDTTLTGWSTAHPAGSWVFFNVDSVSTITWLDIALKVRRT